MNSLALPVSQVTLSNCKQYVKDPVYIDNAIKYLGGDFLRAILGYQVVWDKDFEGRAVRCIDRYLHDKMEKGQDGIDAYYTPVDAHFKAVPWLWQVAPDERGLPYHLYRRYKIPADSVFYARTTQRDDGRVVYDIEFMTEEGVVVLSRTKPSAFRHAIIDAIKLKPENVYEFRRTRTKA